MYEHKANHYTETSKPPVDIPPNPNDPPLNTPEATDPVSAILTPLIFVLSEDILYNLGEMPLPPYIHQKLQDSERYQEYGYCYESHLNGMAFIL